jgi:hypothetical protein
MDEIRAARAEVNPFVVLNRIGREETHARVLAWLLDPAGEHRFGSQVARHLLPRGFTLSERTDLQVTAEHQIPRRELGRAEQARRIDLSVISRESHYLCLVELKTFSEQHSDQLRAYRSWAEEQPDYQVFVKNYLYLTRYGDTPKPPQSGEGWHLASYRDVVSCLESLLVAPGIAPSESVRNFVLNYTDAIRRWFFTDARWHKPGNEVLDLLRQQRVGVDEFERRDGVGYADEIAALRRLTRSRDKEALRSARTIAA